MDVVRERRPATDRLNSLRRRGAVALLAAAALVYGCSLLRNVDELTSGGQPSEAGSPAPTSDADAVASYAEVVLHDTPIGYWSFEEPSAPAIAVDVVGGRNAAPVGAITFGAPGVVGRAVSVAGGYLEVDHRYPFDGVAPFTIELWARVRLDGGYSNALGSWRSQTGGWDVYFVGTLEAGASAEFDQFLAGGTRNGSAVVTSDDFCHVVVTYDVSNGVRMYVDAAQTLTGTTQPGAALPGEPRLYFGGPSFYGTIDEVAVYDRALSVERVLAHYHAVRP